MQRTVQLIALILVVMVHGAGALSLDRHIALRAPVDEPAGRFRVRT